MFRLTLSACFFAVLLVAAAAQPQSAVLESYIKTGLRSNLALQQREVDWQQSLAAVRQAKALFYPTLQFNATYTRAAGGRKIDLPIGDLLNPVYGTLNQITMSNAFPAIENQSIQFLPDNFQETYFKFAYPLFNSDIRYNKQIKTHIADSKLATKAAYEETLRFDITTAYLQYLQTIQAAKIVQSASDVLHELRRFNEALVRNDVATRDVVATADYELSKLAQQSAEIQAAHNTAQAWFNFLLNRRLEEAIDADSNLYFRNVPAYSLDSLVAHAMGHRKEIDALQSGTQAAAAAVKMQESGRILPDAYIGGQFGFQGYGYNFGQDQGYVLAQIGLNYDLYTGGQNKIKIQQAKLEAEKLGLQSDEVRKQIALQVTQAWQRLEAGRSELTASETGLRAAEESYRIVNNKYRAGQAILLEWLDAHQRVTAARLQVSINRIQLLSEEAELLKAAGK